MSRAHDLGSQYPSDAADVAPGDPTSFCKELDYMIPSNKFFGSGKGGNGGGGGFVRIDLRKTVVYDSKNSRRTSMATFFTINRHPTKGINVLSMRSDGQITDPLLSDRIGPMDMHWDFKNRQWNTTSPAETKPFWGIVDSISWPTVVVVRATGVIGNLKRPEEIKDDDRVTCYAGNRIGIRTGQEVYVQWSGENSSPPWTIEQRLGGFGEIPSTQGMAANQDIGEDLDQ